MKAGKILGGFALAAAILALAVILAGRLRAEKKTTSEKAETAVEEKNIVEQGEPDVRHSAVTPQPAPSAAVETPLQPVVAESPQPVPETAPEEPPEETPPEPGYDWPDIDTDSWEYILANASHAIGDYVPELTQLEGGQSFDSRAVDALRSFIEDARAAGLSVYLSSSYRSYAEQEYLYDRKVAQYGGNEAIAATIVAPPGTSEHQTGLCCDITDRYYESKDRSLENTELFKWMFENCARYGFILRYPSDKEDVTGIIYEPWHFRYVGCEAAEYIMENGLCLEEFLGLYE